LQQQFKNSYSSTHQFKSNTLTQQFERSTSQIQHYI